MMIPPPKYTWSVISLWTAVAHGGVSLLLLSPCNLPPLSSMRGCSAVSDSLTPWTVACQALLSMGFFQARSVFPPLGDFPDPGIEPVSPALAGGFSSFSFLFLPRSHVGSPIQQQSDFKMQVRSSLSPFTASSSSHYTWSRI